MYRFFIVILSFTLLACSCAPTPSINPDNSYLDNGTTRAAILWRRMIDHDPLLASQASMYWRMSSVRDTERASKEALSARKMTAQNPEDMVQKALLYRSKRSASPDYESLTQDYWRKFAANDPEVAARFAMYWIENPDANMYW